VKLLRVLLGALSAPSVWAPPGAEQPDNVHAHREPYIDEGTGQLYLLTIEQRNALDPRWGPDAS
jgi:hypothetical protein